MQSGPRRWVIRCRSDLAVVAEPTMSSVSPQNLISPASHPGGDQVPSSTSALGQ
jgi:hypothetical protein